MIKNNWETLQEIYNKFAEAKSPGDPKVIRLNSFIELVTMSGVCDDNFGAREIGPLFNLAMQTQVNEIEQTRHMEMNLIEFVEGLARIADKAIKPYTNDFPIERQQTVAGSTSEAILSTMKSQLTRKKTKVLSSFPSVKETERSVASISGVTPSVK